MEKDGWKTVDAYYTIFNAKKLVRSDPRCITIYITTILIIKVYIDGVNQKETPSPADMHFLYPSISRS